MDDTTKKPAVNAAPVTTGFTSRVEFTIGVDEYVTKGGNKSHAVVIKKNGEWFAGFGDDKSLDLARMFQQLGPERVAEAFRKGAIKLTELRQAAERGRSKTPSKTVESLL